MEMPDVEEEWVNEPHLFPPIQQEYEEGERITFPVQVVGFSVPFGELRELQKKDPLLSLVLREFPRQTKETGPWARNPRWLAIKKMWHQLFLEEGVLYRKRSSTTRGEDVQGKVLVVPNALVAEVLYQCHEIIWVLKRPWRGSRKDFGGLVIPHK